MNPWIEKLRAAETKIDRDEILLRSFREAQRMHSQGWYTQAKRAEDDVVDQLRALADAAFPTVL